jgi:hypothetical protein
MWISSNLPPEIKKVLGLEDPEWMKEKEPSRPPIHPIIHKILEWPKIFSFLKRLLFRR